jgi:23S rRNA (cytidine2498-2'-O)-methyltransferase
MTAPTSKHALALCQGGAEKWLKAEVARLRPDLHAGFQRPGLVTFKVAEGEFSPEEAPPAIFARAWACSAGPQEGGVLAIKALADQLGVQHLFVCPRELGPPDKVPPALVQRAEAEAAELDSTLRALLPLKEGRPRESELVLDVITAPDEPPVVGWHLASPDRHAEAGGRHTYVVPEDLPSRAWRKVVEGLRWSGAPLRPGDLVLEIGAAPGGGTRAYVEAGCRVLAVDPQAMDPRVLALPGVTWIQKPIGDLRTAELPLDVRWIAADAHIAPAHMIRALRRLLPRYKRSLRGLLLTLKLNDEATVADLPRLLDQIQALGCAELRARQLPAHRRDIFVYAPWATWRS